MDSTLNTLTPRFSLFGLVLAVIGGVLAAGAAGYGYFLLAIKAGFDYILVIAALVGMLVGVVVGLAARIGRLRTTLLVVVVAFVFGVAGYAARYYFQFNDEIESYAQEAVSAGLSLEDARAEVLGSLAEAYPPGGYVGYLQYVAEQGFSIGDQDSSNNPLPFQGGLAWGLLGAEALVAGLVAGGAARSALGKRAAAPLPPPGPLAQ